MGWFSSYAVISPVIAAVTIEGRSLEALTAPPAAQQDADGYFRGDANAFYRVFANKVYPDDRSALTAGRESTFTLTAPGAVGFSISDDTLIDNLGGISLRISSSSGAGN
jgi:hypothetical protein